MRSVLISLLLMSCLGCSEKVIYKSKEVCTAPSPALLTRFVLPPEPTAYQDYLIYKLQADALLQKCNARLTSIELEYKR